MANLATATAVTRLLTTVSAATMPDQKRQVNSLRQADTKPYTSEAEADRVLELPGAGKPHFGLFSGYAQSSIWIGQS